MDFDWWSQLISGIIGLGAGILLFWCAKEIKRLKSIIAEYDKNGGKSVAK